MTTEADRDEAVSGLNAILASPLRQNTGSSASMATQNGGNTASFLYTPSRPSFFDDHSPASPILRSPGGASVPLSYFPQYESFPNASSEHRLVGSSLTNSPNAIHPSQLVHHHSNAFFSPFSMRSPFSHQQQHVNLQFSLPRSASGPSRISSVGAGNNSDKETATAGANGESEFDALASELAGLKDSPNKLSVLASPARSLAYGGRKKLEFEELDMDVEEEEEKAEDDEFAAAAGDIIPPQAQSNATPSKNSTVAITPITIKHVASSSLFPPSSKTLVATAATPIAPTLGKFETPLLPRPQQHPQKKKTRAAGNDDEDEEYILRRANAVAGIGPTTCKCKRTKCLKLYCECFAGSQMCNAQCVCADCSNIPDASAKEARDQAIASVLTRNPGAFTPKIVLPSPQSAQQHSKGCNCKKSGCLKKYCECFAMTVRCSDICRCNGCLNYEGSDALSGNAARKKAKSTPLAAMPMAPPAAVTAVQAVAATSCASGNNKKKRGRPMKSSSNNEDDDDEEDETAFPRSNLLPVLNASSVLGASTPSRKRAAPNTPQKLKTLDSSSVAAVSWGNGGELSAALTLTCFDYLPAKDLISLSQVSKGFAHIATSPELWDFSG